MRTIAGFCLLLLAGVLSLLCGECPNSYTGTTPGAYSSPTERR